MFQDKQMKIVMRISILIFVVLLIILLVNTVRNNASKNEENDKPTLSLTTDSNIFKIDSALIYSSANAINNSETQEDYWNLNIYQFSDIALSVDNHVSIDGLTQKNTIRQMYIDNISYPKLPEKGTPFLYYKDYNLLGTGVIDDEKVINGRLDFNVVTSNSSDTVEPSFYADCSNPIILSAVNRDVVSNFVLRNTNSAITFDGNLLLDATVLLSNIEYEISFSIHIINYLDEEYVCNLTIPIILGDNNEINTIYDGAYQIELTNLKENKFYKLEE